MDARYLPRRSARRLPAVAALLVAVATFAAACTGATANPSLPATASQAPVPSTVASPSALPAVTPPPTVAPATFPATLTDDEGTAVAIPAEPRTIVSLTPAATETLFALGVGDRVVGKVEDFSVYPPEAANVPDVAKFGSVDVEKIVGLGADLVIAGGNNFNPPDAIAKLRQLGVPVLVVYAPDVRTAYADTELIGRAVGRTAEAASIVASIRAAFGSVEQAVAAQPRPRVYYELDATNGFFGPAPDYFGTEMIRDAGGDPLTTGTPGVFQLQAEQIVAFDPQVILLGDAAYGVTVDQVLARPGWDVISAVRTGDVRPIDDVIVTRPGPRLADGIRTLATAIHPGLAIPSAAPQP